MSLLSALCAKHSHAFRPCSPADPLSLIDAIHERKMKAGVAISPDTPSTAITDAVGEAADMLLVMTVYPGERAPPLTVRH